MAIELYPRMMRVYKFVRRTGKATLDEIAKSVFGRERPAAKRHSWARNQIRGLRAKRLVKKVGKGTYRAVPVTAATRVRTKPLPRKNQLISDQN